MSETATASDWRVGDDYRAEWPDPEGAPSVLLDAVSDLFYVADRRGRMRDWNDQFQAVLGYTDEEIADLDPQEFFAEEDRESLADALDRVADGEEITETVRLETKSGACLPFEFKTTPLTDDDGNVWGLVGIARDISGRVEREHELERYEQLLETVGEGMYVVDENRRLEWVNDALCDLTGYAREELVGLHLDDDIYGQIVNRGLETELSLRDDDQDVTEIEGTITRKDGDEVPVEVRFSALPGEDGDATAGLVRDISERKERDRVLERYEQLLETVGEGMYVLDEDRHIEWVNEQLAAMLGYEREEVAGMHLSEITVPDSADRGAKLRQQLLDGEIDVATIEGEMIRKDGSQFPAEGRFSLLDGDDGDDAVTIGLVRDISDRVEHAQLLENIHEASRELMTAETKQDVAETAAEVAYEYTDIATAGVRLLEDDQLRMVAITTEDERLEEVPPPFEVGEGFVGEAYENGEPVIYDEGVSEQDTPFDYSPVESAMLIPIEGHGMINLASLEERAFDEETRELARLFAADIESALERADREERLREREQELQEYETLVETVSDGVYMSNEDYEFSMVNEAFVDLLGYDSREELLGKVVPEITVSDQEYEKAVETRQQLIESDQQTVSVENEIECADGTTRQVETRFTLLPTDDGYRGTAGVVRDVSDRKERAALLKRLHEATRGLQTAETKQDVAERATEVADRLGFPTIAVRQEIDGELRVVAQATNIDSLEGRQMPAFEVGEGLVGEAYEGGEVRVYDDLQEAGMKYVPSPIRSAMFVPIEGYGTLSIASPEAGAFGEIEMELGRLFAADVESAIERADREEKLRVREQELQQQQSYTTDLLNAIEDVFYIMDDEGYLLQWNESFNEVTGYSDEEIEGMRGNVLFPEDERSRALESFYETLDSGQTRVETEFLTKDGTRIPHEFDTSRLEDPEGNTVVVGIARDITERKAREEKLRARERELQRQRDELETLNRINELIQGTIRSMASAATREEIETTVCERLAASPFYQFAWTGRRSAEDELVTPRTSAGDGESYLETVEIPVQQWDRLGPGALALKNGTVEVVDDIESDPRCEPWRETALEYGFRSVAVVPFRHGKTVHSILALYADRPAAFSDREQRAFEVLGDMVGFAISAIQHRRLIEAETVLELAIDLPDSETFFAEMARRLNCTCQLLGSVPSGDAMLHYVSVSGASADAADAYMNEAAADRVDDARVVRSTDDGCVIAVRVLNSTPELLQEAGARTVDIRVTPESTRVVTRAARDTDVRMLLDVFRDVHGEPVLDAKREVERDNYTDEAFRTDVADRLTDRQDAALSAAYFGGYFDWPRDSTAEEIADTLDISSATLHQHLRHAQHKLLEIYFDDTTARTGA